jgi:hypothetical protein
MTVYAGIPADGAPPMVGPEYIATGAKATEMQLDVRLAALLNRVVAK